MPAIFDESKDTFGPQRQELSDLLDPVEWAAARRTTINAHYTDPAYVQAIWDGLNTLGFTGGNVLEPGSGVGLFIGLAPETARMVGVELDPVTAAISAMLYPQASIRAESFADSPFPDASFDAVVGNVPFADVTLRDRRHNQGGLSMHNHFIVKSLALTRPGGMVAVLTSRFTMDAKDRSAREAMSDLGDLVTAVRLPSGAHQGFAGTEAATDLLVFQRRAKGATPADTSWLDVQSHLVPMEKPVAGEPDRIPVAVNSWWFTHPDLVVGHEVVGHGMYGVGLIIRPDDKDRIARDITAAITSAVEAAVSEDGWSFTEPEPDRVRVGLDQVVTPVARMGDVRQFADRISYNEQAKGFTKFVDGLQAPVHVPTTQHRQLRALLELRDDVTTVLSQEAASPDDTSELGTLRGQLNRDYDAYVQRFGPVNTVKLSDSWQKNKKTGQPEPHTRRSYPGAVRVFGADPHSAVVHALENYDEATNTATKAAVFDRRVVSPQITRDHADTPADAVSIALDTVGEVRLDDVARLLDVSPQRARAQLGTLVFDDPVREGRLVPAAEYLSGNVRQALDLAHGAVVDRPQLQVNIDALEAVVPAPLEAGDITVKLGSSWVPAADVQRFLRETLDDRTVVVEHVGGSGWSVEGNKRTPNAQSTWGTQRMDAITMAERLLTQKRIVVNETRENAKGNEVRVPSPLETDAAQDKAAALQERFGQWAWEDPARAERLVQLYNEKFNSIVLRSYAEEGQRLSLPGLAATFNPHAHQRAAVARMISEPSVGLYHAVGAGKTAEMVMGAMELRRLGMVNKPAIVVPNHMLEQFTREWLQLYPQAMVLSADSSKVTKEKRREFIARAATGDWDGIILTQSAFQAIAVSAEAENAYVSRELEMLRAQLSAANDNGYNRSVKQLERSMLRQEQTVKKKLEAPRDPGLTWEQTGIDYLIVDEIHLYKNLTLASNIQGLTKDGSQRATDLDMKISLLRERAGDRGRVITGATATPIANSMAEAYVMQHYLRPDLLQDAGITDFDAWAGTFGTTVTQPEMAPEGDTFRMVERFARFQNLPEMLRMWHVSADVQTAADLGLPVPDLAAREDGQRAPEVVAIAPTAAHLEFMQSIGERTVLIKCGMVDQSDDNMLLISGDGRRAGLDLRLLDPARPPASGLPQGERVKIEAAADRIAQIWTEHRSNEYEIPGSNGQISPNLGALQIVFCDLGTPGEDKDWTVYDELRTQLGERGMNPGRIAFIHDANTDMKKGRLFAACRNGDVDVIVGSTEKMGVGTNIQARAVALHHLDCPWRPADLEQRDGRLVRQGNQNPEVQILRYVTTRSFDAYSWQTVERKAKFIDQVMHGRLDQRDADDISSSRTLGFAETMAVTSDNPLLLEKFGADQDLGRLKRLAIAHQRNQEQRRTAITQLTARSEYIGTLIPRIEAGIGQRTDTSGDRFNAVMKGRRFDDRVEVADALRTDLRQVLGKLDQWMRPTIALPGVISVGGHQVDAELRSGTGGGTVHLMLHDLPHVFTQVSGAEIATGTGHGLATRVENLPGQLDRALLDAQSEVGRVTKDLAQAREGLGAAFPHAEELHAARTRVDNIAEQLNPTTDDQTVVPVQTTTASRRDSVKDTTTDLADQLQINTTGRSKVRAALEKMRADRETPHHDDPHHRYRSDGPSVR